MQISTPQKFLMMAENLMPEVCGNQNVVEKFCGSNSLLLRNTQILRFLQIIWGLDPQHRGQLGLAEKFVTTFSITCVSIFTPAQII